MVSSNRSSFWKKLGVIGSAGLAASLAVIAYAEPLVKMDGGKPAPGVVTAWSGSGDKVELTVKDGADPKAVADAIQSGVPKVKAKVQAGKVVVTGKSQDDLLKALSGVEFGGEDFGALAQAASESDSGSGSSLRAKKAADLAKLFNDQKDTALGQVVSVDTSKAPKVMVTVQILRGPTGDLGQKIRKGAKITFVPVMKMKGTAPDTSDEDTALNMKAKDFKAKDKVRVKIGKEVDGSFEAVLIDKG
jgi:hypothetical protein